MPTRTTRRITELQFRPGLSDRDILRRIAAGDPAALRFLRTRHENALYAQVFAVLNDAVDAEHVVSEAFLEVSRNAAAFASGGDSVHAMLGALARARAEVLRSARGGRIRTGAA